MMRLLAAIALLAAVAVAVDDITVLASKELANTHVVQDRDVVIKYAIYNTGSAAVVDVSLQDTLNADDFTVVFGSLSAQWQSIAAGANVTHVVIAKPTQVGQHNLTSATLSFRTAADQDPITIQTSSPGSVTVVAAADYDRVFGNHTLSWIAFAILSALAVFGPYLIWNESKTKHEALVKSK
eukprot:m.66079 g.66079  ORF g.66079 m.66079 type:complete len:182 (-) comp49847_c0_seq2:120-665(-)